MRRRRACQFYNIHQRLIGGCGCDRRHLVSRVRYVWELLSELGGDADGFWALDVYRGQLKRTQGGSTSF